MHRPEANQHRLSLQDIRVYDGSGRIMPTRYQPAGDGVVIDLGPLSDGAYVLRCVYRDGSIAVGRFVVAC
ncbi:MAG: T9SS type A sorting domain-containing protein [Flavobacteriales bacterium]|nr:T9SS type A sorting domain-containing protein [Flavobacteriales bacterium]